MDQDLTMVDPATGQMLFDMDAPMTSDQTLTLRAADDPSAVPASNYPKYECMDEPYKCKRTEICPLGDGAICTITQCGKGNCPFCNDLFENLVYEGYCAYDCMKGDQEWGFGWNLITGFPRGFNGFGCLPHKAKK